MSSQTKTVFINRYMECPDCGTEKTNLFSVQDLVSPDPYYRCSFCGFTEHFSDVN